MMQHPSATAPVIAGPDKDVYTALGCRWLAVWELDQLGECICPAGTRRWRGTGDEALAGPGACARPGKHPWWITRDGESFGFPHGVDDAVDSVDQVRERMPALGQGWTRLGCVPGSRVMAVDIDSDPGWRVLVRLYASGGLPLDRVLGVVKTRRGWHVWLRASVGGWSKPAAADWMRHWLGGQVRHLDVITGDRHYLVMPGRETSGEWSGSMDRHWLPMETFVHRIEHARRVLEDGGDEIPAGLQLPGGDWGPPWDPAASQSQIAQVQDQGRRAGFAARGGSHHQRPAPGLASAAQPRLWRLLRSKLAKLAQMPEDSGRNNTLNRIAFFEAADLVLAGADRSEVTDELMRAARACGCPGAKATVRSGLESGIAQGQQQGRR